MPLNWPALIVFVLLFALITVLGFLAAHWRRGDLDLLHEWGLAGGRFGTVVTWFLLGGDLYTAYTFIAVPALMFGAGALGFFAVPYSILVFPIVFVVFPRLWSVARQHGYLTAADFVRGRHGNKWLALAVAVTGIVATMPYIALQLVGIQVVIGALGIGGAGWSGDLPLVIAFVILAAFTYTSGLRAPAAIAIVKDILIWLTVIVAIVAIPIALGGYAKIFAAVPPAKLLLPAPPGQSLGLYSAYATLAFGSALALFLYPHAVTGVLSASNRRAISRNAALLPAYALLLALIALLGFMALAASVAKAPEFAPLFKQYGPNAAVPALLLAMFPAWFVGVAFAAIAIGALVPAAIMSIAASNLWTRNIYREFLRPDCTAAEEAQDGQGGVVDRQIRRVGFRHRPAVAICDRAAIIGRRVDHPDPAVGDRRALHPLVPRPRAVSRLARRHRRRHRDGRLARVQADLPIAPRRLDDPDLLPPSPRWSST